MSIEIRLHRNVVTNANGTHARWVYSWEADQDVTIVTRPSVYVPNGSTRVIPARTRTEYGQSLTELRRMLKRHADADVRFVNTW